MIIECVGLSGAGKSTAAMQLAARLPGEYVGVQGWREIGELNLLALARHPLKYVRRTARALNRRKSNDLRYYMLRHVFLHRNALVEKARRFPVAIVDEGHLSNVLSAFEEPLSEDRLLAELSRFDLPDVVLRFTLPEDVRKQRLEQRGYFVGSDEPADYLLRWERAMNANDELLGRLFPRLPLTYVHVDEHVSIEALVDELSRVIRG